ncbi:uncharacterized protein BDR25DRAFT_315344 [Lindgomyces ingoldianus]|uniref:Uncharacterized protein n=1 Tax=Lindgomyces ingoldianus TaxID=673940 RepID=A0ACB6QR31_9PLEO|nr:uncharacterized protein BDR25DRAFT_315344 [Lindgomyces ingoldianus]KAF2469322.1 hypothetical protein BDR25DRAFT_315344 [Lindgomyces ingoldianus]
MSGNFPARLQQSNIMEEEPIPSYQESSTAYAESSNPPPQFEALLDEPPAYSILDSNQTTFMIYGTFIHTPAGPAYQLSRALDQRGPQFRIRRLRAKEVALTQSSALAFDKDSVLYEVNDPPLRNNEYHIRGFRKSCFPGTLELRFSMWKWRVIHIPRPNTKGREILSMKVGSFSSSRLHRKKEEHGSDWRDLQGKVVATEILKVMDDAGVLPVIELEKDLDQKWRELLLTVWTARLWVAFGEDKTLAQDGRFRGKFMTLSRSGYYLGSGV